MAPPSSGADCPVSMVSIASGNMDDIQIDDDGYRNFLRAIGDSSAAQPSASVRHRYRSNRYNGDAEQAGTGTLAAPSAPQDDGRISPLDDDEGDDGAAPAADEIITLPESTHSFLFTEPVGSQPFLFGVGITLLSVACLLLALAHSVRTGDIPKNVDSAVKIAQYMAIIIMLLMEEEIPTGTYLLRRIQQPYLKKTFPTIKYSHFVASAVLRIVMGYIFLANVMVVLIMADGVIDIFYDVLALQFIQQLDDIAFGLSKIDAFGKRLQRATRTPFFQFEFVKQKKKSKMFRKMGLFLKAVYLVNFTVCLAMMSVITARQRKGVYQYDKITLKVGDSVWDDAFVTWPDGSEKSMILIYSYFNGVYARDGTRTSNGRPIYVEQKKSDHLPFDKTAPPGPNRFISFEPVRPAEIRWCAGRWIFTHEYIFKSRKSKDEECQWLLRSREDDGFDLLEVTGNWDLWAGVISSTEVSIKNNACSDRSDCNMNGDCTEGVCDCYDEKDVLFLGTHCESKLKDKCRTIISEVDNGAWSAGKLDWMVSDDEIFQIYSRPVYNYIPGTSISNGTGSNFPEPDESETLQLTYSGLRWFVMLLPAASNADYVKWAASNYHAFWSKVLDATTFFVSDPTTGDSPVGVDFYEIRERGSEQFGPLGFLVPMQPAGRGLFRCKGEAVKCSFCADGLSEPKEKVVDPTSGTTCGNAVAAAQGAKEGDNDCKFLKLAEQLCCPSKLHTEADSCSFCSDGITAKEDFIVPESDGLTCSGLLGYVLQLQLTKNDDICKQILLAEDLCCPLSSKGDALEANSAESAKESDTLEESTSCVFCVNGFTAEENYVVPESDGQTCNGLKDYASTLDQSDSVCMQIQLAEEVCCPLP